MEGTKSCCIFLKDISKAAAHQPIYLLKGALLLKKILMIMLKF